MTNHLVKLKKEAQHIRLTDSERRAMHAQIFGAPKPVASPYSYISFFSIRATVSFAAIVVIVLGTTTAYAAHGALPGDALYAIKVNVTEPLEGTLAFSAQAKATFHTSVAERRMEEAETLASTGKLSSSTTAMIEASLAEHVAAADTITASLEEEDPAAGAEVSARFSSSLSAHSAILSRLGQDSDDDDIKKNSGTLAMYVRDNVKNYSQWGGHNSANSLATASFKTTAQHNEVETMSLAVTADIAASSAPAQDDEAPRAKSKHYEESPTSSDSEREDQESHRSLRNNASQLKDDAEDAFEEAQDAYTNVRKSLDATTTVDVKQKLEAIEGYVNAGEQLFDARNYSEAQAKFTQALEESVRLEALIKANAKFDNKNILRNLLWEHGSRGTSGHEENDTDEGNDEVHLEL